jgi:hypothetical protein
MSLAEFRPIPLPKLGGLFTFLRPLDVPSGYSPALANVRFLPRSVLTRPGLTSRLNPGPAFTGLDQFINGATKFLVTLDANGSPAYNDPVVGYTALGNPIANSGAMLTSKEAFGRMLFGVFNSDLTPAGPIRSWNGIRTTAAVPQPALPAITVADGAAGAWTAGTYQVQILAETIDGGFFLLSAVAAWVTGGAKLLHITNIPLGGTGLNVIARWVCVSNVGATALFRHPSMRLSDNVSTAADFDKPAADVSFLGGAIGNLSAGTFYPPALAHLAPDGPGAAPTAADSVNAGSIAVGTHMAWIVYETLFGYLSFPSPPASWAAAGGKKVLITKIPTGPWYVVARRVMLSSAGGASIFYVSTFRIPDNSTTSVEIDITDTNLLQGTNFDYLTRNFALPSAIGMTSYGGRLCVWGALNTAKFTNAGFDGGWSSVDGSPLGWTLDGGFGAGGSKEQFDTFAGDAWRMTGDGATASRGMILNASLRTALALNTAYSVSIRAKRNSTLAQGSLVVDLFSTTLGTTVGSFTVPFATLSQVWTEFKGALTIGLGSIPADLVLRVYASGTPTNNGIVYADHIQIYPTTTPLETSVLRVSNPFDPETFDSINGFQYIAKDNGEQITAARQLRAFLYVAKERSLHVTYDDAVNPASLWVVRAIDGTIGCASPRAMTSSDKFIVFSFQSGAYFFVGSQPIKVSQEIQTTWDSLNKAAAPTWHTLLDTGKKIVYFFVTDGTDTQPKTALLLDYSEGLGQEDDPGPRKWGLDVYPNAVNGSLRYVDPASNVFKAYFAGTKIYEQTGTDDDGAYIDSFYETAFLKSGQDGQDLFGGITYFIEGSGTVNTTLIGVDDQLQQLLEPQVLALKPGKQYEKYANLEVERAKVRFETTQVGGLGSVFTIKGLAVYGRQWAQTRVH